MKAGSSSNWVAFVLLSNVTLVLAHLLVFRVTGSHLVLAQAADSLMDAAVAAILAFTVRVGEKPQDAEHPFGHGRAEPIGALISAVLACVLTLEVGRAALTAAWLHELPAIDASVLLVLAAKFITKSTFLIILARRDKTEKSPARDAIIADSRNDLAATAAAILGYFAIKLRVPYADTFFALATCVYIARNGLGLFRENLRYLMGEAPEPAVAAQLRSAAESIVGVHTVGQIDAHYVGSQLHVEVAVVVDPKLSSTQSHDIGERVQRAVELVAEVDRAFVHVDTLDSIQP
jgi:cation diffusion facilitator family transporter